MPDDDATQQDAPSQLTTAAQLGGIAREALVADTGRARLAGLVREALIAGVGLAGRIGTQSRAQNGISTTFAGGVTAGGIVAATSAARATASLTLALAGRVTTSAKGIAFIPQHITVAGRAATMARGRLAQLGQNLVGGRATVQTRARGSVNLALVPISRQWATVINTG